MTTARIASWTILFALAAAPAAALGFFDGFNRPDDTDMGPSWTEQAYDWRIENGTARTELGFGNEALMTVNGLNMAEPTLGVNIHYQGDERITYGGLVSLYKDLDNCVFVKVQDNAPEGDYFRVFFYWGNNSLSAWPGMTGGDYYVEVTPFTDARLWTVIEDDQVTLLIDRDFNGVPEDVITRGGIPLAEAGTGVGLCGFDNVTLDNFRAVPEPATLSLVALGALALIRRRKL